MVALLRGLPRDHLQPAHEERSPGPIQGSRDKVRVIPNGIDGSWFAVQRKTASHPLVIFVGRLVPEKGAHVLVDAMHDVVREFPDAELVIAGAGPMEHDIRTRAYHGQLGDRVAGRTS